MEQYGEHEQAFAGKEAARGRSAGPKAKQQEKSQKREVIKSAMQALFSTKQNKKPIRAKEVANKIRSNVDIAFKQNGWEAYGGPMLQRVVGELLRELFA
jgi:hypothetical protein